MRKEKPELGMPQKRSLLQTNKQIKESDFVDSTTKTYSLWSKGARFQPNLVAELGIIFVALVFADMKDMRFRGEGFVP